MRIGNYLGNHVTTVGRMQQGGTKTAPRGTRDETEKGTTRRERADDDESRASGADGRTKRKKKRRGRERERENVKERRRNCKEERDSS